MTRAKVLAHPNKLRNGQSIVTILWKISESNTRGRVYVRTGAFDSKKKGQAFSVNIHTKSLADIVLFKCAGLSAYILVH